MVRYWKLCRRAAVGLPHSKHQLSKWQTDANIADKDAHGMTNLHQIERKITEAWTNLCHCQANHLQLRRNHLTELAEAITLKKHPWLEAPQYKQSKPNLLTPTLKKSPMVIGLHKLDIPDK